MSWNYRVMQFVDRKGDPYWEIREVYYDEKGRSNGYADGSATTLATDADKPLTPVEALRWQLPRMLESLEKPILTPGDCETERR